MLANGWNPRSVESELSALKPYFGKAFYDTTGSRIQKKLHYSVVKAIVRYCQAILFSTCGIAVEDPKNGAYEAYAEVARNYTYETKNAPVLITGQDEKYSIVGISAATSRSSRGNAPTLKVRIGETLGNTENPPAIIEEYAGTNTPILVAFIALFAETDPEVKDWIDELLLSIKTMEQNPETVARLMAKISYALYSNTSFEIDDSTPISWAFVDRLKGEKKKIIGPFQHSYQFANISANGAKKTKGPCSMNTLRKKYSTYSDHLSVAELSRVRRVPDWYLPTPELEMILEHITTSNEFRNVILLGPAGVGKTMMAEAIFDVLNIPGEIFSCGPNTDESSLTLMLLPKKDKKDSAMDAFRCKKLPSLIEIVMDPVSSYFALTGKIKKDATDEDCIAPFAAQLMSPSDGSDGKSNKYEYVESSIIKALTKGYGVEIQEPTTILDQGVLVSLNSLLDKCARLTLFNGTEAQRHPKAVVVITSNVGYEGTRNMNQSVLSRMNIRINMEAPSKAKLIQLVKKQTGFENSTLLGLMIDVIASIEQKIRVSGGASGTVGTRELLNWARSTMITNSPYESCKYTVIFGSTGDDETLVKELLEGCLAPKISEDMVYTQSEEQSA